MFQPRIYLDLCQNKRTQNLRLTIKPISFVHYRLKFDGLKGKRKLKGIFFGNALSGDKNKEYSAEQVVKNFKAFTFALRAGTVDRAPPGWTIKSENKEDLMQLGELVNKEVSLMI